MHFATKSGIAAINGTNLYYEVTGAGPALVLIHGYTLDTRMWADQVEAFSQTYQVICYDLRGFGHSAIPTQTLYRHSDDLKALLDFLKIGHAHILGLSLGGAVAVDFALAFPDTVDALVLVDVSAVDGYPWPAALNSWFQAIEQAAQAGNLEQARAHWLNTDWFTPARANPVLAAKLSQIVNDYSGWHFAHHNPLKSSAIPANQRLSEILAPTLVVVGEHDLPFYNLPLAEHLSQTIPHANKIVLPGVGHMANMEDPVAFNKAVLAFLSQTDL